MLRMYMLIIVVGLVGGVVYGAYAYYNDTQQRIKTLQENNKNNKTQHLSTQHKKDTTKTQQAYHLKGP